jgi:hypothetical protein
MMLKVTLTKAMQRYQATGVMALIGGNRRSFASALALECQENFHQETSSGKFDIFRDLKP